MLNAVSTVIAALLLGFPIGFAARWLSPAPNNPSGFIGTGLLGVAGAAVGLVVVGVNADLLPGVIAGIIGAVVVLAIWRKVTGR